MLAHYASRTLGLLPWQMALDPHLWLPCHTLLKLPSGRCWRGLQLAGRATGCHLPSIQSQAWPLQVLARGSQRQVGLPHFRDACTSRRGRLWDNDYDSSVATKNERTCKLYITKAPVNLNLWASTNTIHSTATQASPTRSVMADSIAFPAHSPCCKPCSNPGLIPTPPRLPGPTGLATGPWSKHAA